MVDFRETVIKNFRSRDFDSEDTGPLIEKMRRIFFEAPQVSREYFLYFVLEIIAPPTVYRDDEHESMRLSYWLQRLAFEIHGKLEDIRQAEKIKRLNT